MRAAAVMRHSSRMGARCGNAVKGNMSLIKEGVTQAPMA